MFSVCLDAFERVLIQLKLLEQEWLCMCMTMWMYVNTCLNVLSVHTCLFASLCRWVGVFVFGCFYVGWVGYCNGCSNWVEITESFHPEHRAKSWFVCRKTIRIEFNCFLYTEYFHIIVLYEICVIWIVS